MSGVLMIVLAVLVLLMSKTKICTAAEREHPVYPVDLSEAAVEKLKRSVSKIMAMDEDLLVSLVPDSPKAPTTAQ